jgi:hypothetical protein
MKRFILKAFKTALVLGVAQVVFDQIGPSIAGDYYTLISWGLVGLSLALVGFVAWRLYHGIESGYLLFDDMDDY